MTIFLIAMPGVMELVLILLLILLLFGAKKIPGLMKGIGDGIREFKDAKNTPEDDERKRKDKK